MSRVSKAGRYTEEIEKINAQKIIDSQKRFTAQWEKATGTANANLQLERISESDISSILVHGYPASTWSEPQPTPEPTPQPTIRTTKFGESVSTTSTPQPRLTTYYMKSPSGLCRQVSISADGKKKLESTGHIFSKNNICELEPTTTTTTTTTTDPPITIPEIPEVTLIPEIILADDIIQILNDIENGVILVPDWFRNNIEWVKNGHTTQQEFRTAYNSLVDQQIVHAPEEKETWWVIKPGGQIEEVTVTQNFVDKMTLQGWVFSKDKPLIEQAKNQNISIVFFIGKGGDLKTHFGINSIIVTPDEAEHLVKWLWQNYNTKILLVMNRLTNDIRTHTLQQIKDLVVQKLKDDQPESDDIDDDDIKKPTELGFMGAGVAGAIAGLVLLGFIADYKGGK